MVADNPFHVYQVLYSMFPNDRKTLAVPHLQNESTNKHIPSTCRPLHILVDWSNIFVSFRQITNKSTLPDLSILDLILVRGRDYSTKTLASSLISDQFKSNAENNLKYKVHSTSRQIDETTGKFQEQGVDEILSFNIIELTKTRPSGIIALATGDGKPSGLNQDVSFISSIEAALKAGWIVEVYSFKQSLSNNWKYLKDEYNDQLCIFILDELITDM